ncbi:MAG: hypothetical protein RLZZ383_2125 [Pseudomonadota bacterium]
MIGEVRHRQRERWILDAAHARLLELGFAGMNLDVLARELGMSKATLYKHFPSKDALAAAVLADQMQATTAMLDTRQGEAPLAVLLAMLRDGLRRRMAGGPTAMGLRVDALAGAPRVVAAREAMVAATRRLLLAAQADGSVRSDVSVGFLVAWVHALFGPSIEVALTLTGDPPEAVIDQALAVFSAGICVPKRASGDGLDGRGQEKG